MSTENGNDGSRISRRDVMKATSAIAASAISSTFAVASANAAEGTKSSKASGRMTVAQYVLSRLKELDVTHTFGVPGDFIYDMCDAIFMLEVTCRKHKGAALNCEKFG